MTEAAWHSYDRVPYGSTAEALAHVPRLEVLAALCGLTPAPVATARVLELGCGTGANLLPLALEFPGATIVGCDLAVTSITSGRTMVAALGIANLTFRHTDFTAIDASWGQFDYVICHDVFSAVTPDIQQRILRIMAERLTPQGVAYLSHDALPGWHLHDVALDMMRYHARHLATMRDRVDAARTMLALAAETQDQDQTAYAALIREQYWLFGSIPDEQLYHLLDGPHRAFYHEEFLALLPPVGLRWLGDAGIDRRGPPTEGAHRVLDQLPASERPQYLDFLCNRSLRRAVLCRQDAALAPRHASHAISRLSLGLNRRAKVMTETPGALALGVHGDEPQRTSDPAIVGALATLDRLRPELVPLVSLIDLQNGGAVGFLLEAVDKGLIEAQLSPPTLTSRIDECPVASPLARLEAGQGAVVTNRMAAPVHLDAGMRFVIQLLDGTRDLAALVQAVEAEQHRTPGSDGPPAFAGLEMSASEIAVHSLERIRDQALLVRPPS